MKSKTISSVCTFFYKYFSILMLGILCPLFVLNDEPAGIIILFIMISLPSLVFLRLKRVAISNDELIISNYLKSIRVPVSKIQYVSESIFFTPKTVSIIFNGSTEFGQRITFLPKLTGRDVLSLYMNSCSVVAELDELIERHSKTPHQQY